VCTLQNKNLTTVFTLKTKISMKMSSEKLETYAKLMLNAKHFSSSAYALLRPKWVNTRENSDRRLSMLSV
jgi:hypothetical protein